MIESNGMTRKEILEANSVSQPAGSIRFDWLIALLAALISIGTYIDGWAHNNIPDLIETFFTPYHALLYGSFSLTAAVLTVQLGRNLQMGYRWQRALPKGYMLAMVGIVIFGFAGVSDLVWHETFGFEENIEALLSPTHLMLGLGGFLIGSAPLRSMWGRNKEQVAPTLKTFFPALLSATLILGTLNFFTEYSNLGSPVMLLTAPGNYDLEEFLLSIGGIYQFVTPMCLTIGMVLFLGRRWLLPAGSIAFILMISYLAIFFMEQSESFPTAITILGVAIGAGLSELIYQRFLAKRGQRAAMRVTSFALPFLTSAGYLTVLLLTEDLWWAIHMWAGVPVVAGVAGLLLSYLAWPPAGTNPQLLEQG